MEIRKIKKEDIKELWSIWEKYYNFPFPDLSNPLYCVQRVVIEKNKIVLAGIVRLTAEGIFITNKELSPLTRMKAIKLANNIIWEDALNLGLEDGHTFAEEDPNYIGILRRLGWQECTGIPLVRIK